MTPPRKVVRTLGQSVAEVGLVMSRLALYPDQLDLLSRLLSSVCHSGGPKTGKTIVLLLTGMQWLKQGKSVQVVSGRSASRSVSF